MKPLVASNLVLISSAIALLVQCSPSDTLHPEWRGLLASRGFEGTAIKGVYFFPGEGAQRDAYTTHPLDERDLHWNSDSATRGWVMDRMVQAHVNTVVMSYWGDMPQWSPMDICSADHRPRDVVCHKHPEYRPCMESNTTVAEVLEAVRGRSLVVMPAIEQGNYPDCPEVPQWDFSAEFPFLPFVEFPDDPGARFAPHLVASIGKLVELFRGKMDLWARVYDRDGKPRYAVEILHVSSNVIDQRLHDDADDKLFAKGFDDVEARVSALYHIDVGFMIDTTGTDKRYSAYPSEAGAALERTRSVLAVQGFASEIFSGLIKNGLPDEPCTPAEHGICEPHDNNRDNLERLADWKRDALRDWVRTGVPVILDVDNGYDGRVVFGKNADGTPSRIAFWGDNLNYTEDRWRNWLSELKGPGIKGIVFDTWNGYTEGYAAVPSLEHGQTVYNWLIDLFEPPPWDYSHMHYVNGARTHRVYGAICEKWVAMGADRGFGPPVSEELPSAHGRMQCFADQAVIYWSGRTGAHAVIGAIAKAYREAGGDASCLGLPVSDEESAVDGKVSRFEHGTISWKPGDVVGHVTCR